MKKKAYDLYECFFMLSKFFISQITNIEVLAANKADLIKCRHNKSIARTN